MYILITVWLYSLVKVTAKGSRTIAMSLLMVLGFLSGWTIVVLDMTVSDPVSDTSIRLAPSVTW